MRLVVRWAPIVVVTALVLSGCTQGEAETSTRVSGQQEAVIQADDVVVTIPVGAVDQPGEVSARTDADFPQEMGDLDGSIRPLVPVEVTLEGTSLVGEATVTFLNPAVPEGSVPVVVWQGDGGAWELLPSEVAEDGSVVARTNHFSWGFLGSFDPAQWARDHAPDVGRFFLGRAGAQQPACGDEQSPREAGVSVTSDSGDMVKWCFGLEDGQQVLKVVNNKTTFAEFTYPTSWTVKNGASTSVSSDAVARVLGTQLAEVSTGRAARVVDAGDTLTLIVPPGSGGRVVGQISTLAWVLSGIAMGVEVYGQVASALKATSIAETSAGTFERVLDRISGANLDGYDAAFRSCGEAVADATEHDDNVDRWFATLWLGCIPGLMQADIAATGVRMFALGAVLTVIATAVSVVYTAASLITSGVRELWDTVFTPKEAGNNVYRIRVAPPPKASTAEITTRVVNVTPVDPYGGLSQGFAVAATLVGANCSYGSNYIGTLGHRCLLESTIYDPCWYADDPNSDAPSVMCLANPWESQVVHLVGLWDLTGGDEFPDDLPPWGLQLSTGERCRAASGARDDVAGTPVDYYCGDGSLAVLRGIDTSVQPWTASVVSYADGGFRPEGLQPIAIAWVTRPSLAQPNQGTERARLVFPGPVRLGDTGAKVSTWQSLLIEAGIISDIPENRDGVFGPGLDKAVREYQSKSGLTVDGVAGEQTWSSIAYLLEHQNLQ